MAQQINLYSPILLTPKRYFSALAMLQAGAGLALGLLCLALWAEQRTADLRQELAGAARGQLADAQRLRAQIAAMPAVSTDTAALERELAQARLTLVERQRMLAEAAPAGAQASGHAAVLRLLAQTLPASMWLTEVRLTEGRIELSGQTQQPEALRPWLDRLRTEPALAGQSLQALKVERSVVSTGVAETWDFRVVNARKGGALP